MVKKQESTNSKDQELVQVKRGGNTSTTELRNDVFIKYIPREKYDYRVSIFQTRLYYNINDLNGFEINMQKPVNYNKDVNTISDFVELHYEVIKEVNWDFDQTSVSIIAENMAKIHNHCYDENDRIDLPHKELMYDDLSTWKESVKNKVALKRDLSIRKKIQKDINGINEMQVKIALHRDFRKHNILWDGNKYVLIDFDFAAFDFISIEIMSFISDILDDEDLHFSFKMIEIFFEVYKKHSKIKDIIWKDLVTDYLNYLCVNTFPLYLKDTIPHENFKEMMKQRNNTLLKLYKFKSELKEIIK
jgi:hypothetical protein